MTFEDSISAIYNQEPETIGELMIVSTIGGSNLLFVPKDENEYNVKHRYECILCSMFYHIILVDVINPNIKPMLVGNFMKFIKNLISSTELHNEFQYNDFLFSYTDRYNFYGNEISKIKPNSTDIPFRLLNLIYDNPAIFDLEIAKSSKFDFDLDTRIPQTMKVKNFLKHTLNKVQTIIGNSK